MPTGRIASVHRFAASLLLFLRLRAAALALRAGPPTPMSKVFEKLRILRCDRAVDLQTFVSPVANPIAVVQVGMTGITVPDESFVVTSARADRLGPARVAVVFGTDMSAIEEVRLFRAIDSSGDVSQSVLVRVHEPMARRDVARWTDSDQSEARAARM